MAEEKKEFPWVQLIATIGTIMAALIGITPYLLKLNSSSAPSTPTIVFVTLPPATTTPAPVTTAAVTATGTAVTTTELPPGPSLQVSVNSSGVLQGGPILVAGSTNPAVPQVTITLTNSTGFRSVAVPVTLTQGAFQVQLGTSDYAPGQYTIIAGVPDTQAIATASFTLIAAETPAPTTEVATTAATTVETTTAATTVPTTVPATTAPATVATTLAANTTPTTNTTLTAAPTTLSPTISPTATGT